NPLQFSMTPCEISYLAGIIDGEGTLSFKVNKKHKKIVPILQVTSTDQILIDWLQEKLSTTSQGISSRSLPQRKISFEFWLKGLKLITLLEALQPYLLIKKEQCGILIGFIKSRLNQNYRASYSQFEIDCL